MMKHIKLFNESYKSNLKDTLNDLKSYFTTDGAYTNNLLDKFIISPDKLVIELDIPSAYKDGKSERDGIKYSLKRAGFEPAGTSQFLITLQPEEMEWVKNFFSNL